ncbi:class I SAM-dependent methyltransferase [Mycolicibacterium sp. jd]|uniref:class I SAM-dependent methyltransferase n=1 Tax=unclassified Mycolicibacterium TaxID=2636767 RepID=UPI00351AC236
MLGAPQPDLLALIDRGQFHGEVLDAGCGTGALSLHLAAHGYATVGLDLSATAIAVARGEAARRRLTKAVFEVADITEFSGFDNRFGTVVDSALFHTMPPSFRDRYQESIVRAAAPGASYFVLVFDKGAMPKDVPVAAVTPAEIHDVVSRYWIVDDVKAAEIYADSSEPTRGMDESGRLNECSGHSSIPVVISSDRPFPAWLVTAHLD